MTCCMALWLYYFIVPKQVLRKKVLGFIISILVIGVMAYLKDFRRMADGETIWPEFSSYVGMTFMFVSLFYLFDQLNLFVNNSYVKTKLALRQAENKLLRQQLNPHFLFNAFNSLYSMSLSK